jgi:hypothetical protein
MDLRRIVDEVEARKQEELAYTTPARPKHGAAVPAGVAASILHSVRDRMLRENPGADVGAITEVIEPDRAVVRSEPPRAKVAHEPAAAAIARVGHKTEHAPALKAKPKDDFLARYLVLSEEFERRFAVKGWTDLVRKKCSADLRH